MKQAKAERHSRRKFLATGTFAGSAALVDFSGWPTGTSRLFGPANAQSRPPIIFPPRIRERLAVASYPFREFVIGANDGANATGKMPLKEFGAHVAGKFGVHRIEPWSEHLLSLEPEYLAEIRRSFKEAGVGIANVAVDGQHSPYAADLAEREQAIVFSKQWIDAAAALGSVNIRTNIPPAKGDKEDLNRLAESLRQVADYGASKGVVVHLENDNPVSEDPFFLAKLVQQVNSRWLHTLPDFCNSLAAHDDEYAYKGITEMFAHAFGICHVKAMELSEKNQLRKVDLARTFGILKASGFRGYCSMEFDSPGDPYSGTKELIAVTEKYLG